MKRNLRLAHAPHCYWHDNTFYLSYRAPKGTQVTKWEGMPDTITSEPHHMLDYEFRDQQRRNVATRAREKREEKMEEKREKRRREKREEKMEEKKREKRRREKREKREEMARQQALAATVVDAEA